MRLTWGMIVATLCLLAGLALAQNVNRSGTYKVGDTVEAFISHEGRYIISTILQINGDDIEVHYGGSRYNKKWITRDQLRDEAKEQAKAKQIELTRAFWDEVQTTYYVPVAMLVRQLKPNVKSEYAPPEQVEHLTEALTQLTELDALCKRKYAGLVDTETVFKDELRKLPATWCEVAAKRMEAAKKVAAIRIAELMKAELARVEKLAQPTVRQIHVVAGSWYKNLYAPGYDKVKGVVWTSKNIDLLTNGGKETLAEVKARLVAWSNAAGAQEDPAVAAFEETYAAKLGEVKAAIDASLPPPVFVAKAHDSKMEAAGKKAIAGKILKSAVMTSNWITTISPATRKPISRVKIGTIFYKQGAYCIYRSYAYKQDAVRGTFSGPGRIQDFSDWMMRCK